MKMLLLSAHIDDADTGCGGSVARFAKEGHEIHYAVFTWAADSLSKGFPYDAMIGELNAVINILGIKKEHIHLEDFKVRHFPECRQPILEKMVKLNKEIKPDLVFMPSKFDTHQDHAVIHQEGFRAFKMCSILCYEMPWNNISFEANYFISLSKGHIQKKIKALECYKSQEKRAEMLGRKSMDYNDIYNWASFRGMQIREEYAEAFHCLRIIER